MSAALQNSESNGLVPLPLQGTNDEDSNRNGKSAIDSSEFSGVLQSNLQNCRDTLLDKFENLANQLSAGWKYHITNTEGIREAWLSFEDFYTEICSLGNSINRTRGHSVNSLFSGSQYNQLDENSRTPERCQELLMEKVGAIAGKLLPNWLFAIANTEELAETWNDFERYFQQICVLDRGK
ncbi:unnamed protein product [Gongylonema pulchrum]|uniref:Uncharacterized protein n=1 Tax=Gongylonema pulchrum TaxID=637853 RepID=A0A183CXK2_9BILA|nr:unnamed protein product [Gongylonema pulchrum]